MMKDYDEYLKKKLAKIKKDGIIILDSLTGKERFHLANAAKRTGGVSTFTIGEDKRVVLRYKPKYEEFIDSKKMLEEAKEAYRDKDYEKSIKTYRVLLALGAPKAFVFAGLGLGYYHLNKKRLASSYLLVATELSKQNNEEFDFTQMIETLNEDYTDLEEKKSSVKVDEDEFKSSADDYYGITNMAEVSDLVFQGMSISDVCKKMNYDTEKENIILLIFAREYYIQQNYELGDKCLKRVEKSPNKTPYIKKLYSETMKNKKLYKNKSNEDHKCLKLSFRSKI